MISNTNDGTGNPPGLRVDINYNNCQALPDFSKGPKGGDRAKHECIKAAGFGGIQDGDPELCRELGLHYTAHARIDQVGDLKELPSFWKGEGFNCATLHVGWGMEDDSQVDFLVDYVLNCSVKNNFPLYIETHRATITQDMQRTVGITRRFPEVRFNGDFSHWYTGQEMVYGGIENKWDFIAPVFDRVRFMHGRIGNPGSIQVTIAEDDDQVYVDHFREMWIRSFEGFLKSASEGDYICFAVELLAADIFYAREVINLHGKTVEEGDRWQQALLYMKLVRDCWKEAVKRVDMSIDD